MANQRHDDDDRHEYDRHRYNYDYDAPRLHGTMPPGISDFPRRPTAPPDGYSHPAKHTTPLRRHQVDDETPMLSRQMCPVCLGSTLARTPVTYCPDPTCQRAHTRADLIDHSEIISPRNTHPDRVMRRLPCGHAVRNSEIMFQKPPCKHCLRSPVGRGFVPLWLRWGDFMDNIEEQFAQVMPPDITGSFHTLREEIKRQMLERSTPRVDEGMPIMKPYVDGGEE